MGQIKDRSPSAWKNHGTQGTERVYTILMEKEKKSSVEEKPKVRYSDDGFWTTQHPIARAFSVDWFKTHLAMIPYCWEMLRMAMSVSKMSVLIVSLGTVARAVVDAAQLYAYTRFVNEVMPH